MEVTIIEYFPEHGFEVWITDVIEIGYGMGDVFTTYEEALAYAQDQKLPVVDIAHITMSFMDGKELRTFFDEFLEFEDSGIIKGIKHTH